MSNLKGLKDGRLTCGKYRGKLLSDIIRMFPSYVKWLVTTGRLQLPPNLKV